MCESIFLVNCKIGVILSNDILILIFWIVDFVIEGYVVLGKFGLFRINVFGYFGDGNLYYNVYLFKGEN